MKQPEMKNVTIGEVKNIVNTNDKKRYTISQKSLNAIDTLYIRANQGHSKEIGKKIDSEKLLTKITEAPPICVHGTNKRNWKTIKDKGLSPMGRTHIHLASGLPNDPSVTSGMRTSSSVLIFIDMQKAINRGKTFY